MSRIIVTGGLGFIGSEFVNYVMKNTNHEVVVLDKMTYAANIDNIKQPFHLIKKDICEVTQDDLGDYDYIVNFAAETHVDNSILNGRPFVETNVMGTFNLLELARKNSKLKKFLQISTDEVYGSIEAGSWTEEWPLLPNSPYSASKAGGELLARSYNKTHGLDVVITRCSNNYGPFHFPEKLIPLFVTNLLEGKKIPVYGSGMNVRDWLHVDDHCRGIHAVLMHGRAGEIYNIGEGNHVLS